MALKILVVDDDEMNLEIVSLIVQNMGYAVVLAADGRQGYNMAQAHHPDIIVTDYQMPYMTGVELAQSIRSNEVLKHIPIIAMTADIYTKQALLDAGCDAYLVKPIRKGRLLRTITQLLSVQSSSVSEG